jgi:hypothetical protein
MDMFEMWKEESECLGDPRCGGSDAFDVFMFQDVIQIVRPFRIIELGFNRGDGSLHLLLNSDAYVTSVDLHDNLKSREYLKLIWGDKFEFVQMNSQSLATKPEWIRHFDLAFVDSEHTTGNVSAELAGLLKLEVPFILFDDIHARTADEPQIREAISQHGDRIKFLRKYMKHELYYALPERLQYATSS